MTERILNSIRGLNMGANEYRVLNKPRCRVYRAAAYNVPAGSSILTFDATRYDTDQMWSSATPTRVTANTPGVYLFTIGVSLVFGTGNGNRGCWFRVTQPDGTTWDDGVRISYPTVGGLNWDGACPATILLNKGDYVEPVVYQGEAGAIALVPSTATSVRYGCDMSATLISTL